MLNNIKDAIRDIKAGKAIVVVDNENRENEGDLVASAELMTEKLMNFIITEAKGLVCVPLSKKRAEMFGLDLMVHNSNDMLQTAFTVSVDDDYTNTTGISALDRTNTVKMLADKKIDLKRLRKPGHIFPLIAKENLTLERDGHTEAAVELMKLANLQEAGVICEIIDNKGEMMRLPELRKFAKKHKLTIISIEDLKKYVASNSKAQLEDTAIIPTKYGKFNLSTFKNADNQEHIAFWKGKIDSKKEVVVRMHSECLTGDIFGSLKCDCGEQLDLALKKIDEVGSGIIVYLRQEGRGIGLKNKMKAYKLQQKGLDTVEANNKLGFEDDLREYNTAIQILNHFNVKKIKLLSNNPRKISALEDAGFKINREKIIVSPNKYNDNYLKIKKEKLKHLISEKDLVIKKGE